MGGGIFGSGSKKTSTTNYSQDNIQNTQQGSLEEIESGSGGVGQAILGDGAALNIDYQISDHDAVDRAFNYSEELSEEAFSFGSGALSEALGFGRRSLDTVDEGFYQAANISKDAVNHAADLAETFIYESRVLNGESLTSIGEAQNRTLDFIQNTLKPDQGETAGMVKFGLGLATLVALFTIYKKA